MSGRMSSHFLLPGLPKSGDPFYDLYLQRTLGKCLPPILTDLSQVSPVDPVEWLAEALRRSSENQVYLWDQLAYLEWLNDIEEQNRQTKEKKSAYTRYLRETPVLLKNIYWHERLQEQKLSRWIIDHQDLVYRQKLMRFQDELSELNLSSEIYSDVIHDMSHGALVTTVTEMEERLDSISKEIVDEKTELHKVQSSVLNPNTFQQMKDRFALAHQTSSSRQSRRLSRFPSVHVTASDVSTDMDSSDSSIAVHTDDSTAEEEPMIPPEKALSRFDSLQRRFTTAQKKAALGVPVDRITKSLRKKSTFQKLDLDEMRASRMIQEAINRGQFRETEDGYRVAHIPGWKKIGQSDKKNKQNVCNLTTLMPSTWENMEYHVKVFYEPELYSDPDIKVVTKKKVVKKSPPVKIDPTKMQPLSIDFIDALTPDEFQDVDFTLPSIGPKKPSDNRKTSSPGRRKSNSKTRRKSGKSSRKSLGASFGSLESRNSLVTPQSPVYLESGSSERVASVTRSDLDNKKSSALLLPQTYSLPAVSSDSKDSANVRKESDVRKSFASISLDSLAYMDDRGASLPDIKGSR